VAETAGLYSNDVSGATDPSTLVSRLDFPQFRVAVDANELFWSDEAAIYRTSLGGGAYDTFLTLPPGQPDESPLTAMVSDGTDLFYSDGHAVYRVSLAGGTPDVITNGWSSIEHLAVSDTSVFFTDSKGGAVVKVGKCAAALGGAQGQGGAGGQANGGTGGQGGTPGQAGTSGQGGTTSQGGLGGLGGFAGSADCSGSAGTSSHGCPAPVPMATVANPYGLAIDDSYLYFSVYSTTGGVMRVPLSGGDPEPIAPNQDNPHDIAVDATNVYFCVNDNTAGGHLQAVPKAGGTVTVLATALQSVLERVATDGAFAYYITGFNSVYRISTSGGSPAVITAGPYGSSVNDVAVSGTDVFLANGGINYPSAVAGSAFVGTVPVSGRPDLGRHRMAPGVNSARVAVDAANVYFIDSTSVYRSSRSGGDPVVLGSSSPASGTIYDMLSDGQHVYFADAHAVYRMPVTGGAAETLTGGWGEILALAVDDTNVYFTDYTSGVVMKRPK
jgi:hypothetical protein